MRLKFVNDDFFSIVVTETLKGGDEIDENEFPSTVFGMLCLCGFTTFIAIAQLVLALKAQEAFNDGDSKFHHRFLNFSALCDSNLLELSTNLLVIILIGSFVLPIIGVIKVFFTSLCGHEDEESFTVSRKFCDRFLNIIGGTISCLASVWIFIFLLAYALEVPDCLDTPNDVVFKDAYPFLRALFAIQMAPLVICCCMICFAPCVLALLMDSKDIKARYVTYKFY